jgi:outer membrane protein OmpA-like peptidoglycan-associated protein
VLIGFPTGGTIIDAQNRLVLQEVVRSAQSRDDIRRVRVEGHTDSCGADINNMQLSMDRAVSVANELVTMGVPREMLETVGFSDTQPMAEERCDGRPLSTSANRRVEFTMLVCQGGSTASSSVTVRGSAPSVTVRAPAPSVTVRAPAPSVSVRVGP